MKLDIVDDIFEYKVYNLGFLDESIWVAYYDYFCISFIQDEDRADISTGAVPKEPKFLKLI